MYREEHAEKKVGKRADKDLLAGKRLPEKMHGKEDTGIHEYLEYYCHKMLLSIVIGYSGDSNVVV